VFRLLRMLAAVAVVALSLVSLGAHRAAAAVVNFGSYYDVVYSGATDASAVVPTGACGIEVEMVGGAGGSASDLRGGLGGLIYGTIPVGPDQALHEGDTLEISVGGQGSGATGGWGLSPGGAGGPGGMLIDNHGHWYQFHGFGGGGATTIAVNGTLLAVAGGGGGAASDAVSSGSSVGGDAGVIGTSADDGGVSSGPGPTLLNGVTQAQPGTTSGPGAGGGIGGQLGSDGGAGILGAGGDAWSANSQWFGGGGGGGGYYGGGGGGQGFTYRFSSTSGAAGSTWAEPGFFPDPNPGLNASRSGNGWVRIWPFGCQHVTLAPVAHDQLYVGQTYTVPDHNDTGDVATTATVDPSSAGICSVSGSTFTMERAGSCSVTVAAPLSYPYAPTRSQYAITVLPSAQSIQLSGSDLGPLPVGQQRTMVAQLGEPDPDAVISVSSSDTSICTTDASLVVTAVGEGTCQLTFSTAATQGHFATSTTVNLSIVTSDVRGLDISGTNLGPMRVGDNRQIAVAIVPSAPSSSISASSADRSICTVSGALSITAVAVGTCTITLSVSPVGSYSGATTTFSLSVLAAGDGVQVLDLSGNSPSPWPFGTQRTLAVSSNATGAAFSYTSLTPSVCYVANQSNQLNAQSVGTCTIRVDATATQDYFPASATLSLAIVPGDPGLIGCSAAQHCYLPFGTTSIPVLSALVDGGSLGIVPPFVSTSNGALTVRSTTPKVCTVRKGMFRTVGLGACVLAASQAATAEWQAAGRATSTVAVTALGAFLSFPTTVSRGKTYTGTFTLQGCTAPTDIAAHCGIQVPATALSSVGRKVSYWPSYLAKPVLARLRGTVFTVRFTVPKTAPLGAGSTPYAFVIGATSSAPIPIFATLSWKVTR
jgi:hypothetical protein